MKKLLLFFAALCCALTVSAEKTYYDVLPSGTGVYERTIVNMEYDVDAQTLSFDDTYLPSFTAYQRIYAVYFSEWKPEYKYVLDLDDVYYGEKTGPSSLIKPHTAPNVNAQPDDYWFARTANNNSNGGHVTIDLKSAIEALQSISTSTDFLVSIGAQYIVGPEATPVLYSTYEGDYEADFLLNSKHISLVYNNISVSPVIVKVKNDQGIVAPENPKSVEIAPNGTDGVQVGAEITMSKNVGSDVEYVWEYIDDNRGQWKEFSKGVVTKDEFNSYASNRKVPFASVSFTAEDKPVYFRYFRVRLSTDDSAVSITYDNPVEIGLDIPLVKYPLYIYDVQVDSKNCNNLGQTSDRYIKYDVTTNTLSMNDVGLLETKHGVNAISYYGNEPLNIYIKGTSLILNSTNQYAMYSESADVKIYGDGSLTIANLEKSSGGISIDGNLTVSDGAKLWVEDHSEAKKAFGISLYGDGVLTVDYATIEVEGTPAIWNVKDIVMKNGVNILSAGHKFDAAKKAVVDASGNATNETVKIGVGEPDAIQNVVAEKASQNGKFVRNNQLIIKRNGVYYNANGVKVSAM